MSDIISRRKALLRLGALATVAYATPVLMTISKSQAKGENSGHGSENSGSSTGGESTSGSSTSGESTSGSSTSGESTSGSDSCNWKGCAK
jgi:hypothetical protein